MLDISRNNIIKPWVVLWPAVREIKKKGRRVTLYYSPLAIRRYRRHDL